MDLLPDNPLGDRYARVERFLERPMMALTLLFIAALIVPLQRQPNPAVATIASMVERIVWGAFVIEYVLLLSLARSKPLFIKTHLLDLAIIALPALRVLRFARLARLVRLARFARLTVLLSGAAGAVHRARRAFAHYRLGYILVTLIALLLLTTGLMLYAEHQANPNLNTYFRCLWWGVVTMTTVGYGDAAPVTVGGRAIAIVFMLLGIGLAGVVTATTASVFVGLERQDEDRELRERLERLETGVQHLQNQLAELIEHANSNLNKAS